LIAGMSANGFLAAPGGLWPFWGRGNPSALRWLGFVAGPSGPATRFRFLCRFGLGGAGKGPNGLGTASPAAIRGTSAAWGIPRSRGPSPKGPRQRFLWHQSANSNLAARDGAFGNISGMLRRLFPLASPPVFGFFLLRGRDGVYRFLARLGRMFGPQGGGAHEESEGLKTSLTFSHGGGLRV